MSELSATVCSFLIKKTKTRKDNINNFINLNEPIKDINGIEYDNIISVIESFFKSYNQIQIDEVKNKSFSCKYQNGNKGNNNDFSYIYSIVNSGTYGSSSSIIDGKTKKNIYDVKATDISEKPCYVYVVCKNDIRTDEHTDVGKVKKGILIFQNVGGFGVKTITTKYLEKYLSENFELTLVCRALAPEIFVKKMLKAEKIKNLYLIKNNISEDRADNLDFNYGKEIRVLNNVVVKAGHRIMNEILHCAKDKRYMFEFDERTKYDNVKVEAYIGESNKTRIIDLHNIDDTSIREYLPQTININENEMHMMNIDGHPNKEPLLYYLEELSKDYLSEMICTII